MKRTTILDIRDSLARMETRIELDPELIERARRPVERMLARRKA